MYFRFSSIMKDLFIRSEGKIFFILLTIFLLPVVFLTPFVTLDGPAHLYNARLLHDLIVGPDQLTEMYYELNPVPEPNWSGHFIMSVLVHFIPALWAEKTLQLLILLGFGIGYRKLILTFEPSAGWNTWLLFPLLYNFTFLIGFYNFMIGLTLLPFFLLRFIRHYNERNTFSFLFVNILLLTTIYFSHLLIFLIAGLLSGLFILCHPRRDLKKRKITELLITAAPGIILTINYFILHGNTGYRDEIQWLPPSKIIDDMVFSRGLIMYDYLIERRYTVMISILLAGLLIAGLLNRTIQKYQRAVLCWLVSAIAMLFLIPDSMASGGIITPRLELWLMITLILYLAVLRIPPTYAIPAAMIAVLFGIVFNASRLGTQTSLQNDALIILKASPKIRSNAQLLPINQSSNWMHSNLTSYLGAVRPIVILDNYEADHRIFPVRWKENMNPSQHAGNHASVRNPCITIEQSEKQTGKTIDYISIWMKDPALVDTCIITTSEQLRLFYDVTEDTSGKFVLYRRKNN